MTIFCEILLLEEAGLLWTIFNNNIQCILFVSAFQDTLQDENNIKIHTQKKQETTMKTVYIVSNRK